MGKQNFAAVVCAVFGITGSAMAQAASPKRFGVVETEGVKVDERKTVRLELVGAGGAPLELSIQSGFLAMPWASRQRGHALGTNPDLGTLGDIHCVTPCTVELPAGGYGVHLMPRGSFGFLGPMGANQNLQLSQDANQRVELTYIDDSAYRRTGAWVMVGSVAAMFAGMAVSIAATDEGDAGRGYLIGGSIVGGLLGVGVGMGLMLNFDEATAKFQAPTLCTASGTAAAIPTPALQGRP